MSLKDYLFQSQLFSHSVFGLNLGFIGSISVISPGEWMKYLPSLSLDLETTRNEFQDFDMECLVRRSGIYKKRMLEIVNTVLEKKPDVACFQEVLPKFAEMISQNKELMNLYRMSSLDSSNYDVLTLAEREYDSRVHLCPFP